jgi:murein DD-endopeptidase MepM/ murein hydrolase activator NlpD
LFSELNDALAADEALAAAQTTASAKQGLLDAAQTALTNAAAADTAADEALAAAQTTASAKQGLLDAAQTALTNAAAVDTAADLALTQATADAVVDFVGQQNGYGNVIFLNHGKGHTTVYAHLHSMAVSQGQAVIQGQYLGGVGSTGWATGPHLHFEFRVDGIHQDPEQMARVGTSSGAGPNAVAADYRLGCRAARRRVLPVGRSAQARRRAPDWPAVVFDTTAVNVGAAVAARGVA